MEKMDADAMYEPEVIVGLTPSYVMDLDVEREEAAQRSVLLSQDEYGEIAKKVAEKVRKYMDPRVADEIDEMIDGYIGLELEKARGLDRADEPR